MSKSDSCQMWQIQYIQNQSAGSPLDLSDLPDGKQNDSNSFVFQ